jgi:translation initiation factor eIF-2B subunit epsilon
LGDDVPFVEDPGSETDSDIDADSSDGYSVTSSNFNFPTRASSVTSAGIGGANVLDGAAEKEFLTEVRLSLERAFDEGHSVENAAVELKTLRMASNVPIAAVRHAIIGAIVDRSALPAVEGQEHTAAAQRASITKFVQRWGALVNEIGGIDQVEAILQLQEQCAKDVERTGRFGQLLGAFYQCDVVEEEHVSKWHKLSAAKGEGKSGEVKENMGRCWVVGGVLLKQLEAQSEESEEESD